VSDWSQVAWFRNGDVWFDPAQGGIPIVDGPIYGSGTITSDSKSKLPLFVSQGTATQHAAFSGRTFDVTIGFEQLANVLRIVAGPSAQLRGAGGHARPPRPTRGRAAEPPRGLAAAVRPRGPGGLQPEQRPAGADRRGLQEPVRRPARLIAARPRGAGRPAAGR